MTTWEERALRREQEDPRRRATVSGRMGQGLASQLPMLLGGLGLLMAGVAAWHGLGPVAPGGGRSPTLLVLVTAVVTFALGAGAFWTRNGDAPAEVAHMLAFVTSLGASTVVFVHLIVTGNPLHGGAFGLVVLSSAAFFQDGWRLAVAGALALMAWGVGLLLVGLPESGWPPTLAAMGSTALLATLVSLYRVRELRRLESLNLELQAQIGFDPLTGIANRRAFQERLTALWTRLAAERGELALILVDLDHFKNLNDTRGHGEGDAALRQVGGVLRMAVRSTEDLPARLGGEEFAILLPRTREEHALLVAERVREAVSYTRIPNPGTSTGDTLTASLGIAMAWPGEGGDFSDLFDRADAALYRAKSEGRNRVVLDRARVQAAQAYEPSPFPGDAESPSLPPYPDPHRDSPLPNPLSAHD